jgi:Uma2 family endonuclease
MVLTKQRYTFEQWLEMPDDGRRYELLNGELVEMAPPTANHALLIAALHAWLLRARNAGYGAALMGPVAVLLDASMRRENAPEPDVFFIRREREHIITDVAVEGVPDLIIEVLSPTNRRDNLPGGTKWDLYEDYGVPAYMLVDPEARTVTQYAHQGNRYGAAVLWREGDLLVSPLFPGVALSLSELFGEMRPPRR